MATEKKIVGSVSVPQANRTFAAGDEEAFEAVAKEHKLDLDRLEQAGAIQGFGSKKAQEGEVDNGDPRLANSQRAQAEKEEARKEGAKGSKDEK